MTNVPSVFFCVDPFFKTCQLSIETFIKTLPICEPVTRTLNPSEGGCGLLSFICSILHEVYKSDGSFCYITQLYLSSPHECLVIAIESNSSFAKALDSLATQYVSKFWMSHSECSAMFVLQPLVNMSIEGITAFYESTTVLSFRMCTSEAFATRNYACFIANDGNAAATLQPTKVQPLMGHGILFKTRFLQVISLQSPAPMLPPNVPVVSESGLPIGTVQVPSCPSMVPFYIILSRNGWDDFNNNLLDCVWTCLRYVQHVLKKRRIYTSRMSGSEVLQSADATHQLMHSFISDCYDTILDADLSRLQATLLEKVKGWNTNYNEMPKVCRAFCITHMTMVADTIFGKTDSSRNALNELRAKYFAESRERFHLTSPVCFNLLLCDRDIESVPAQWRVFEMNDCSQYSFTNLLLVSLWHASISTVVEALAEIGADGHDMIHDFTAGVMFSATDTRCASRVGISGVVHFFFNPCMLDVWIGGSFEAGQGPPTTTKVFGSLQATTYTAKQRDLCMAYFLNMAASLVCEILQPEDSTMLMVCLLSFIRAELDTKLRDRFISSQKHLRMVRQKLNGLKERLGKTSCSAPDTPLPLIHEQKLTDFTPILLPLPNPLNNLDLFSLTELNIPDLSMSDGNNL